MTSTATKSKMRLAFDGAQLHDRLCRPITSIICLRFLVFSSAAFPKNDGDEQASKELRRSA